MMERRIIELETAVADLEKTVDELNQEVVRQAKIIEQMEKEHKYFRTALSGDTVKPQSEETKPPHY